MRKTTIEEVRRRVDKANEMYPELKLHIERNYNYYRVENAGQWVGVGKTAKDAETILDAFLTGYRFGIREIK